MTSIQYLAGQALTTGVGGHGQPICVQTIGINKLGTLLSSQTTGATGFSDHSFAIVSLRSNFSSLDHPFSPCQLRVTAEVSTTPSVRSGSTTLPHVLSMSTPHPRNRHQPFTSTRKLRNPTTHQRPVKNQIIHSRKVNSPSPGNPCRVNQEHRSQRLTTPAGSLRPAPQHEKELYTHPGPNAKSGVLHPLTGSSTSPRSA